jgi:hypothetical protein
MHGLNLHRRNLHRSLFGKSEEKMQLARHRCRKEYYVKMEVKETECDCVNWLMALSMT